MLSTDLSRDSKDATFAADLQRQVYRLVRAYELCDHSCLTSHGVTAAQSYALLALPASGAISMNELSRAMDLAGSTMTRVVDELVRKDLVTRRADDDDRRVVRVQLTDSGRQVQREVRETLDEAFGRIFEEIPRESRDVLLRVLAELTDAIGAVARRCC